MKPCAHLRTALAAHNITAQFVGNAVYGSSQSAPLTEVVFSHW